MQLNTTAELIEDIRQGKMVILMDDEDRENEGDLIIAADQVKAADINFMATYARGLICLTLTPARCQQLELPLMVKTSQTPFGCNFTISIEAAEGVTTGISAADRARTIQAAVAADASPKDVVQPGHIFPVMAKDGGVLRRAGHTEAGCDLARLAGCTPAAAICEVMNEDGSMARRPDLEKFARQHGLKIGTIVDLVHYRIENEQTVERIKHYQLPTEYGDFEVFCYRDTIKEGKPTHLALVKGEIKKDEPVLARVLETNTIRDLLGVANPQRPSWSLHQAMKKISEEGKGVVVILANDNEKSSLADELEQFHELTEVKKLPSHPQGMYLNVGTGSQILRDLGVGKMRLLSYPTKYAISGFDLEVVEYIPCEE
ncbi:MAG: 3,4-dihydroxy-2-butanone-4-phosphate synthase [Gammaproteobacteria bacterium]|nr:3,4-dihydroxy-2-butanone-4-phosphate synthase [Gammaproteobacteria bacterium]|tara:strand:- start:1419 stop:2537 length:1119 start_codon:yes stop_codon:yes gene_type:complete